MPYTTPNAEIKCLTYISIVESIGIGAQGYDLPVGNGKESVTLDVPHRIVNLRYYADLVNFLHMKGLCFEKEVLQMAYSDAEYGAVLQCVFTYSCLFSSYWLRFILTCYAYLDSLSFVLLFFNLKLLLNA